MDHCESCMYYVYDEEYESYYCDMDLDEDEMVHFLRGTRKDCPYYRSDNEYEVVKHQA
ncbi:MAG: hypothetical protein IJR36_08125 [Lachnospiraceae bacterium]|nr:hypothetical protein [Lachnospiraceae bacterium]MBQ9561963.1 hypothetical protein [Lachnospiraceae bacterium]MBQ9593825.1 hypothetical protein [Lachnospiraceae bacterium]MBR0152172.1 hypothetical protein [Lachnospiraceae bacterium]